MAAASRSWELGFTLGILCWESRGLLGAPLTKNVLCEFWGARQCNHGRCVGFLRVGSWSIRVPIKPGSYMLDAHPNTQDHHSAESRKSLFISASSPTGIPPSGPCPCPLVAASPSPMPVMPPRPSGLSR
eukprot:4480786-Pyramimonas_sp.AAC.1